MNQLEFEASIERAAVVVACLIKNDGKYLLVQERQPKAHGLWNLPAGHVDKGELIREAAIREAREETGFEVSLDTEIALIHEETFNAVKHVFSANIVGGEMITSNDEIMDIQWLSFSEIKTLFKNGKIRRDWVWNVISNNNRYGN